MNIVSIFISTFVLTGCLEAQLSQPEKEMNSIEARAVWSASALLRPMEVVEGNGFAEVQFQDDKTIKLAIRVNLPHLEEGEYHAYIERNSPPNTIRLSVLTQSENGSYVLTYLEKVKNLTKYGDLADYDNIVIKRKTSEREHPVLQGKLTIIPW